MEGPKKQADLVNIVSLIAVSICGAFGVFISFVGLQAFYDLEASQLAEKREAEGIRDEYNEVAASHRNKLSYGWADKNAGRVRLDIQRSVELVLADAKAGRASNLVPVVGPHLIPTVPAVFGRPPDDVKMPAASPTDSQPATDGAAQAPDPGQGQDGAAPQDGAAVDPGAQPAGTEPAGAPQPAPAGQAAPAAGQPGAAAGQPPVAPASKPATPAGQPGAQKPKPAGPGPAQGQVKAVQPTEPAPSPKPEQPVQ